MKMMMNDPFASAYLKILNEAAYGRSYKLYDVVAAVSIATGRIQAKLGQRND